jgi:hypothetical protein
MFHSDSVESIGLHQVGPSPLPPPGYHEGELQQIIIKPVNLSILTSSTDLESYSVSAHKSVELHKSIERDNYQHYKIIGNIDCKKCLAVTMSIFVFVLIMSIFIVGGVLIVSTKPAYSEPFVNTLCIEANEKCYVKECYANAGNECNSGECFNAAKAECDKQSDCSDVEFYCTNSKYITRLKEEWKNTYKLDYKSRLDRAFRVKGDNSDKDNGDGNISLLVYLLIPPFLIIALPCARLTYHRIMR